MNRITKIRLHQYLRPIRAKKIKIAITKIPFLLPISIPKTHHPTKSYPSQKPKNNFLPTSTNFSPKIQYP